jgi:ribose/xylose/arabinose/galactoside ABC-type transport system permease subunit
MTGDGGLLAGGPLAVPAGLLAMLAVGACLGAINGAAVAGLGMPPFIVTLTVLTFFRGFARWINQSRSIYSLPAAVNEFGGGTWWQIPRAVVLVVPLALAAHWILRRGLVGRWLYAVGLNGRAALVSGVPVAGTIFFSYVFCGCCASMASVIYTGRLETASAEHGDGIFLDVIAAVVIGGTSLFGGKGTIPGTIQGVFFITLIDTSLNWFNRSNFTIAMVKGSVILLAALLDALRRRLLSRA